MCRKITIDCNADEGKLRFIYFTHSHGDLTNIFGTLCRNLGLSLGDENLRLSLNEIAPHNRRASMVPLTSDPEEVLEFLGLDASIYWDQFPSLESMFTYATTCRFFTPDAFGISSQYVGGSLEGRVENEASERIVTTDKLRLGNSKENTRFRKRAHFRKFVLEYLTKLPHPLSSYSARLPSREELREEIWKRFPLAKVEADQKLSIWSEKILEKELWSEIHEVIPLSGKELGSTIRALKKETGGIRQQDELVAFVKDNWEKVWREQMVKDSMSKNKAK